MRGQSEPAILGLDWVPQDQWTWGAPGDFVLFGPDAGNWAANARALMEGGEPDINRLPVFGLLTWLVSAWRDVDVVFGGHLVNHLAGLALGCVVYFLGRELGGRGVGLGAGLLTAASPWLIQAASLYGVDPSFGLTTALLFVATWLGVSRGWWAVPLTGLAIGLVMATHYLGILFPIPCALALALAEGDWKRRFGAPIMALATGWLSFRALMWRYPAIGLDQIASVYSTGAASGLDDQSVEASSFGANALSIVGEALSSGLTLAVQQSLAPLRDAGLPWGPCLLLFWVGLVGFGLPPQRRSARRWAVDWRTGLLLLALMAPLALLEAVRAPQRYRYYAQPLVFITVLRGLASVLVTLERALSHKLPATWPRWPLGLLAIVPVCWLGWALAEGGMRPQWTRGAPADQGLHERLIGELVLSEFGAGGGIVTNSQVAAFHAERSRCSGPAPGQATPAEAISQLRQRCLGRGALPYLVGVRSIDGYADITDEALDAYVAETFEAVGSVRGKDTTTTVYRIPR